MNNVHCNHANENNGNDETNSLCFFCKKCYALLCFSCRLTHPHKNDLILCNTDVKYSQINFSFISSDINLIYKNYSIFSVLFPYLSDITQSLSMFVASFLNCSNVFNNKFSNQKDRDDLIKKIPSFIEKFGLNNHNNLINIDEFRKYNNELIKIKEIGETINEVDIQYILDKYMKKGQFNINKILKKDAKLNDLCNILDCNIEDIIIYKKDS